MPGTTSDAVIFLDVYASDRDPLVNMNCTFMPVVYAYEDVSADLGWDITDVIYQFSVNSNIDELHLVSAHEDAEIEFFFATSARDVMEKAPTATGVGSLIIYPKTMNR